MGYIHKLAVNKKGIALIGVYLVVAVLIVFAITFVNASIGQNNAANLFKKQMQAFNLAESGLDKAVQQLRDGSASNFPGTLSPVGTYAVTITDLGLYGTMRRFKIVSVGTSGNISKRLTNIVQTDNYARYIWFTDAEIYRTSNVWFWNQDHLNGPTQTNGQLNIGGNDLGPIFDGEVRSASDQINFYNNRDSFTSSNTTNPPNDTPSFNGGITLGANAIRMPRQATYLRSASANGGLSLTGDTTVVLNSASIDITNSGYYNAHCTGRCRSCCTLTNQPFPANGALFVDNGKLSISGTLSGRLTAGASGNITVTDDVVYASDPRTPNSTSTDMLGLISESNVTIADSATTNASDGLEIDASIMALNTSFILENWDSRSADYKGQLTIYGGIIQTQRGPVGTFNQATGDRTGYYKNYSYDPRMLATPPPFFPTTGDYVTLAWQED